MSYILDALNKSEQERREQEQVPNLQAIHQHAPSTPMQRARLGLPAAILAALAGIAASAIYLLTDHPQPTTLAPATPLQVQQADTAPAAAAVSARQPAVDPVAADSAHPAIQRPTPTPAARAETDAAVNSLYRAPADPPAPVDVPPAVARQMHAALARSSIITDVRALPQAIKTRLPDMYYSAHIYSNEEGKGFAIINDRSRYKGDVIGPGLFVQEVREEGVVLNFEGQAFLLEALTDWPAE